MKNRFAKALIGIDRGVQGHPIYIPELSHSYGKAKIERYIRADIVEKMLNEQVEACVNGFYKKLCEMPDAPTDLRNFVAMDGMIDAIRNARLGMNHQWEVK
jgi:hypothetical protein